jgi:hypothetical protein
MRKIHHAFLGAVFAAEPDGTSPLETAHNDPVGLAFADRDLVNADDLRSRLTGASDLLAHILHLKRFDSLPIEKVLLGHILDRRVSTASTNMKGALSVEWIFGQPMKTLLQPLQSIRRISISR